MVPHIHPDVEEVRANPTSGEHMTLVLVVDEEKSLEIVNRISETTGVELTRELDEGVLILNSLEEQVETVVALPGVRSVSPDGEAEILQ
ncbi:hypothetical protein ACFPM1_07805 [Halorubrum rubrum]|uniref:Putative peptidase inhibitor domain-containing protein n=1 Tax=Halorubrum rubrum TaxID=1126240 RepID=A0ABD5R116_9EURY|nr:hypothetical protein [Halorubrum rubrum]